MFRLQRFWQFLCLLDLCECTSQTYWRDVPSRGGDSSVIVLDTGERLPECVVAVAIRRDFETVEAMFVEDKLYGMMTGSKGSHFPMWKERKADLSALTSAKKLKRSISTVLTAELLTCIYCSLRLCELRKRSESHPWVGKAFSWVSLDTVLRWRRSIGISVNVPLALLESVEFSEMSKGTEVYIGGPALVIGEETNDVPKPIFDEFEEYIIRRVFKAALDYDDDDIVDDSEFHHDCSRSEQEEGSSSPVSDSSAMSPLTFNYHRFSEYYGLGSSELPISETDSDEDESGNGELDNLDEPDNVDLNNRGEDESEPNLGSRSPSRSGLTNVGGVTTENLGVASSDVGSPDRGGITLGDGNAPINADGSNDNGARPDVESSVIGGPVVRHDLWESSSDGNSSSDGESTDGSLFSRRSVRRLSGTARFIRDVKERWRSDNHDVSIQLDSEDASYDDPRRYRCLDQIFVLPGIGAFCGSLLESLSDLSASELRLRTHFGSAQSPGSPSMTRSRSSEESNSPGVTSSSTATHSTHSAGSPSSSVSHSPATPDQGSDSPNQRPDTRDYSSSSNSASRTVDFFVDERNVDELYDKVQDLGDLYRMTLPLDSVRFTFAQLARKSWFVQTRKRIFEECRSIDVTAERAGELKGLGMNGRAATLSWTQRANWKSIEKVCGRTERVVNELGWQGDALASYCQYLYESARIWAENFEDHFSRNNHRPSRSRGSNGGVMAYSEKLFLFEASLREIKAISLGDSLLKTLMWTDFDDEYPIDDDMKIVLRRVGAKLGFCESALGEFSSFMDRVSFSPPREVSNSQRLYHLHLEALGWAIVAADAISKRTLIAQGKDTPYLLNRYHNLANQAGAVDKLKRLQAESGVEYYTEVAMLCSSSDYDGAAEFARLFNLDYDAVDGINMGLPFRATPEVWPVDSRHAAEESLLSRILRMPNSDLFGTADQVSGDKSLAFVSRRAERTTGWWKRSPIHGRLEFVGGPHTAYPQTTIQRMQQYLQNWSWRDFVRLLEDRQTIAERVARKRALETADIVREVTARLDFDSCEDSESGGPGEDSRAEGSCNIDDPMNVDEEDQQVDEQDQHLLHSDQHVEFQLQMRMQMEVDAADHNFGASSSSDSSSDVQSIDDTQVFMAARNPEQLSGAQLRSDELELHSDELELHSDELEITDAERELLKPAALVGGAIVTAFYLVLGQVEPTTFSEVGYLSSLKYEHPYKRIEDLLCFDRGVAAFVTSDTILEQGVSGKEADLIRFLYSCFCTGIASSLGPMRALKAYDSVAESISEQWVDTFGLQLLLAAPSDVEATRMTARVKSQKEKRGKKSRKSEVTETDKTDEPDGQLAEGAALGGDTSAPGSVPTETSTGPVVFNFDFFDPGSTGVEGNAGLVADEVVDETAPNLFAVDSQHHPHPNPGNPVGSGGGETFVPDHILLENRGGAVGIGDACLLGDVAADLFEERGFGVDSSSSAQFDEGPASVLDLGLTANDLPTNGLPANGLPPVDIPAVNLPSAELPGPSAEEKNPYEAIGKLKDLALEDSLTYAASFPGILAATVRMQSSEAIDLNGLIPAFFGASMAKFKPGGAYEVLEGIEGTGVYTLKAHPLAQKAFRRKKDRLFQETYTTPNFESTRNAYLFGKMIGAALIKGSPLSDEVSELLLWLLTGHSVFHDRLDPVLVFKEGGQSAYQRLALVGDLHDQDARDMLDLNLGFCLPEEISAAVEVIQSRRRSDHHGSLGNLESSDDGSSEVDDVRSSRKKPKTETLHDSYSSKRHKVASELEILASELELLEPTRPSASRSSRKRRSEEPTPVLDEQFLEEQPLVLEEQHPNSRMQPGERVDAHGTSSARSKRSRDRGLKARLVGRRPVMKKKKQQLEELNEFEPLRTSESRGHSESGLALTASEKREVLTYILAARKIGMWSWNLKACALGFTDATGPLFARDTSSLTSSVGNGYHSPASPQNPFAQGSPASASASPISSSTFPWSASTLGFGFWADPAQFQAVYTRLVGVSIPNDVTVDFFASLLLKPYPKLFIKALRVIDKVERPKLKEGQMNTVKQLYYFVTNKFSLSCLSGDASTAVKRFITVDTHRTDPGTTPELRASTCFSTMSVPDTQNLRVLKAAISDTLALIRRYYGGFSEF